MLVLGKPWRFASGKEEAQSTVGLAEEAGYEQGYQEWDKVGLAGVLVSPVTNSSRTQRSDEVKGFRPLGSFL